MSSAPWYLWALVVVGLGLILLAVARELRSSAMAAGVEGGVASRAAALFAVGYAGWVAVTVVLAAENVYRLENGVVKPWLLLGLAVPLAGLLVSTRLPFARRVLSAPGLLPRLTRPHGVRVVGVIFLLAMILGEMPPAFALPAGLGDIAIGLTAPWVARGLRDGNGVGRMIRFNVLGLVDFVVAFAIAILAAPGRIEFLHLTPTTERISTLPLVLIPTAAVPLLFALHLISLAKLRSATVPNPTGTPVELAPMRRG
jgi:hypothetical protein